MASFFVLPKNVPQNTPSILLLASHPLLQFRTTFSKVNLIIFFFSAMHVPGSEQSADTVYVYVVILVSLCILTRVMIDAGIDFTQIFFDFLCICYCDWNHVSGKVKVSGLPVKDSTLLTSKIMSSWFCVCIATASAWLTQESKSWFSKSSTTLFKNDSKLVVPVWLSINIFSPFCMISARRD